MSEKVAIVGSRNYPDLTQVRAYVASLPSDTIIVSGGARGVDTAAEEAARAQHLQVVIFPAEKGKSPLLRNHDIVAAADLVVAFWDGASTGTMHTVGLARKAGKPVEIRCADSTPKAIKVISLWQPWAALMVTRHKQLETRSWGTRYRGLIAIHAARRWTAAERLTVRDTSFAMALAEGGYLPSIDHEAERYSERRALDLGAIIGIGELVSCYAVGEKSAPPPDSWERLFGAYGQGRYMWYIRDVRALPEPFEIGGKQGLWDWQPLPGLLDTLLPAQPLRAMQTVKEWKATA
jgi:activating signal cointegrator 1